MTKGQNDAKWRPFKNTALLFEVVSIRSQATQKQQETNSINIL
jgi:hypothetical protein